MIGSNTVQRRTAKSEAPAEQQGWLTWQKAAGAAAVALLIAAAVAYWKREAILQGFEVARDSVLGALGLGLVAVLVWVLVLRGLARWRPIWWAQSWSEWFSNVRLWASTGAFLAFSLGVMAFFRAGEGILGGFTLQGDVPLSGWVGEAIIGPVFWQGVLRVFGLFLLTGLIASPARSMRLSKIAATNGARTAFTAYMFTVLALRIARLKMRRLLMHRPKPSTRTYYEGHFDDNPNAPREDFVTDVEDEEDEPLQGASHPAEPEPDTLERWSRDLRARLTSMMSDVDQDIPEKAAPIVSEAAPDGAAATLSPAATAAVKFNKYWSDLGTVPLDVTRPMAEAAADGEDEEFEADEAETEEAEVLDPAMAVQLELRSPRPQAVPLTDNMANKWGKPPREILRDAEVRGITEAQMVETAETIRSTLTDYGVEVEIGQIRPGPTVTMYGLDPGWVRRYKQGVAQDKNGRPILDKAGKPVKERVETKMRVRVDSILAREKDLALALRTPSIRIETPVMGKSLVGIEVPNPKPDLVTLRAVMESDEFKKIRQKAALPIALGKGSGGETVVADLAKMPHMLVAGATGSGKSVCLNTIVSCLIMEKSPSELRLLLIDPKRVELTPYNGIPHLLTPVVVESDKVVGLLKGMIGEMLNRYKAFESIGVRNIDSYNKKATARMPYLVIVVDELADLMMTAAFDVEHSLCRLAQLGRATGIHLVVATQRPSVDVVTGLIKANFPSRISFGVTSQIDSRTILDSAGAEKLLGKGDMLYAPLDASRPSRIQGVYVSDDEVEELVKFWETTKWPPVPQLDLAPPVEAGEEEADEDEGDSDGDELFDRAVDMARSHKKLSTSLLQRRLRIGYPRAARLMDELEDKGVVGPSDGSKSRDVIISGVS